MSGKGYPVSFPIRQQLPLILNLLKDGKRGKQRETGLRPGLTAGFPYRESKTSLATRTALAAVGQPA